jgi:Zn-dependent protease with chaperone function
LQQAAKILNTEAPDLYVRQNPVPNAYTLAISGKKPFIVVHTSLVELLSRKELQVPFHIHFFPTGVAWLEFY